MGDCCYPKKFVDGPEECQSVPTAEACAPGGTYYPNGKPGATGCSVSNLILANVRRTFGDEPLAHELAAEAIGSLRRNYLLLLGESPMQREIQRARNALHDVFFYLMVEPRILSETVSFILSVGLEMRFITSLVGAPEEEDIERRVPEELLARFVATREWLELTPVGSDGRALVSELEALLRSIVGLTPREILSLLQHANRRHGK